MCVCGGCPPGVLVRGAGGGGLLGGSIRRALALRTLILPGGRRRPGGAAGSPEPSRVPGSWWGVTQTTAPRGGGARDLPARIVCGSSVGGVRVFVGAIGVERAHRGGGGGPRRRAPSRAQEGGREHPRRGRPPARSAAQLWSALGNFCPQPAGPIFREFWGFASSSHPGPQRRARGGGGRAGGRG